MKNYLHHMEQSVIAKDFCSWIEAYQKAVWHRIGHSRSIKRMKVYETVITQNFVFDLALKKFSGVKIFESKDERKNGSDLLIEINCGGRVKKLAVQAKIVYSNEIFPRIDHVVRGVQQIDLLLNYARVNGCKPAYMFYGYSKSSSLHDYGISIADATHIENKYFMPRPKVIIPKMTDLFLDPHCLPANNEFCCRASEHILNFEENQVFTKNLNIWKAIEVQASSEKLPSSNESEGFNPAYLIQVSGD
jgi:hypothetical protein